MGRFIILGAALTVLWLLLSGYFDEPLLLGFGAASVALSVWLAHRAGMLDPEGVPGGVFPGVLAYMPWLIVEIGKANLAVARQALSVKPKLSPMMIRVPARQTSTVGRVIFANSITLTPGTVSVDLDDDCILVHALTEELGDEAGLADMGGRVARIERRRA
ncbi:MAG: Na+/H+ antiporter subunit E [Parvularculaceae bacterium]